MENTTRTPGKNPTGIHDKIELRSEKVRKLIGEIPPSLVRWGAAIIAIVFLALLAALCFSNWEGITRRGVFLLAAILAGGGLSCAVCGKAGKRRGKRLVKSTKKPRLS